MQELFVSIIFFPSTIVHFLITLKTVNLFLISVLLVLLGAFDVYFITFAYHHTLTKGASVQLVFGFEYAVLLTVIVNTAIKYVLHIIDMNREVFWENKAVFLLHVEVLIGL